MVVPGTKFPRTGQSLRIITIWTAQLPPRLSPKFSKTLTTTDWAGFHFNSPSLSDQNSHVCEALITLWESAQLATSSQDILKRPDFSKTYEHSQIQVSNDLLRCVSYTHGRRRRSSLASPHPRLAVTSHRAPGNGRRTLRHSVAQSWPLLYSCWEEATSWVAGAKIMQDSERFPGQQRPLGWRWKKQDRCKIWRARGPDGQSAPRLAAWPVSAPNPPATRLSLSSVRLPPFHSGFPAWPSSPAFLLLGVPSPPWARPYLGHRNRLARLHWLLKLRSLLPFTFPPRTWSWDRRACKFPKLCFLFDFKIIRTRRFPIFQLLFLLRSPHF